MDRERKKERERWQSKKEKESIGHTKDRAMTIKRMSTKRGGGLKNKKKMPIAFNTLIKHAKLAIQKLKPDDVVGAVRVAVNAVKRSKSGRKVEKLRTIPIPTITGGSVLPLVPIFAVLNAIGAIAGGVRGILNVFDQCMHATNQLRDSREQLDAIAIGKETDGYYLHADTTGNGFFLSHSKNH